MLTMTKKAQLQKNLKLTEKLAKYLVDNPTVTKSIPSNASYVFHSVKDKKLNKANEAIIKSLLSKGTTVVKVKETKDQDAPWQFTPLTP